MMVTSSWELCLIPNHHYMKSYCFWSHLFRLNFLWKAAQNLIRFLFLYLLYHLQLLSLPVFTLFYQNPVFLAFFSVDLFLFLFQYCFIISVFDFKILVIDYFIFIMLLAFDYFWIIFYLIFYLHFNLLKTHEF